MPLVLEALTVVSFIIDIIIESFSFGVPALAIIALCECVPLFSAFVEIFQPCPLGTKHFSVVSFLMTLVRLRRSAILQMKDNNMAYHHLIAYTELFLDGRDVDMATAHISQQGRSCDNLILCDDDDEGGRVQSRMTSLWVKWPIP